MTSFYQFLEGIRKEGCILDRAFYFFLLNCRDDWLKEGVSGRIKTEGGRGPMKVIVLASGV